MRGKEILKANEKQVLEMIENKYPFVRIAEHFGVARDTVRTYIKTICPDYNGNPGAPRNPRCNRKKLLMQSLKEGCYLSNSKIKNKLIQEGYREEKCEMCGRIEWLGQKIPLALHHKDFNHWNNTIENFQILCPNCHMIAHNYCTKNKPK